MRRLRVSKSLARRIATFACGGAGVNLSHATSITVLEPMAGEENTPRLHGVAILGAYSLPHAANGHIFEFWCKDAEEQQAWIQAYSLCLSAHL